MAEEDKNVVEFFKRMISAFDIDLLTYDYQEIETIPKRLKELIIESDCIIAIATKRDKIEGTDYWACPNWIHDEIALAHAYNKPIAIFFEEGVKIDGLIALEERRETFYRDDFLKNVDKISKFLFKLREHLDASYQVSMIQVPRLLRHYIRSQDALSSKDYIVEKTEILMESLIDGLDATSHYIELEETTPGMSVKAEEFEFKVLEKEYNTNVKSSIVINTDFKFQFKVLFDPPLKKGQRVKYAFKEVRKNYRPYTHKELTERIKKGTYEYEAPKCEACEWTITYPTYELQHEFEFPEGYEIENLEPYVVVGIARTEATDEIRRIKEGNMFSAEKMFDKWVIKLRVPKPLLNHTYYTYYTPSE